MPCQREASTIFHLQERLSWSEELRDHWRRCNLVRGDFSRWTSNSSCCWYCGSRSSSSRSNPSNLQSSLLCCALWPVLPSPGRAERKAQMSTILLVGPSWAEAKVGPSRLRLGPTN